MQGAPRPPKDKKRQECCRVFRVGSRSLEKEVANRWDRANKNYIASLIKSSLAILDFTDFLYHFYLDSVSAASRAGTERARKMMKTEPRFTYWEDTTKKLYVDLVWQCLSKLDF